MSTLQNLSNFKKNGEIIFKMYLIIKQIILIIKHFFFSNKYIKIKPWILEFLLAQQYPSKWKLRWMPERHAVKKPDLQNNPSLFADIMCISIKTFLLNEVVKDLLVSAHIWFIETSIDSLKSVG